MRFNNKDSSSHIEKFLEKVIHNMTLSGMDRHINTRPIMETFFRSFLSRLDKDKNFYFIENSSVPSFNINKSLYDSEGQSIYSEIRYDVNQILKAEFRLSAYDMGDHNKIQHVMEVLGADSGHKLYNECFGDSYVISEPVIFLAMDPMGYNDIRFSLKFNINPKIYKRSMEAYMFGNASIQFPHNYNSTYIPPGP